MRSYCVLTIAGLWLAACSGGSDDGDASVGDDAAAVRDAAGRADAAARADTGVGRDAEADEDAGVVPDAACMPACMGRVCGDDGCGGVCGTCPGGTRCADGACVDVDPCSNGVLDPGEQRVDCGGSCAPCTPRACTRSDSDFVPEGYDCIWQDEFGGEAGLGQARRRIDDRSWTFQNLDVNGELQNYTNRECVDAEHANDWNYCVQDGLLTIRARPDGIDCSDGPDADNQPDNPDCALDWGFVRGRTSYTSGRIMTKHKVAHQYGYIEFRARLPQHDRQTPESGFWPAIWMLGNNIAEGPAPGSVNWPACGEVDILEWRSPGNHMGYNVIWAGPAEAFRMCTIGSPACGPCVGNDCRSVVREGDGWRWTDWSDFPHDAFHTYGFLWTAQGMEILIDGEKMATFTTGPDESEFRLPMFLIVNLALGGSLGGAVQVTDWSKATLEVDYLRWYQPL